MPIEVIMPKVDMDMASGKIVVWHVSEGTKVSKGDPLFDIETDKAAMEVEAPGDGILQFPAPEGSDVPIGKPVAWLYAADEAVGDAPQTYPAPTPASAQAVPEAIAPEPDIAVPPVVAVERAPQEQTLRATPRARALARESGMDLTGLAGSGPRSRVQAEDVRKALHVPPTATLARFVPQTGPLAVTTRPGGTGTPVVLIHGFASDAMSWAPVEKVLRDRPLIRIDLPAHGKSPRLRIGTFRDLVREVRHAFDELNLEKAHLVGHSLGGALALALADTRARGIASLTMIAPAGLGAEINGPALSGICHATRAESLGPWLRSLVSDETLITDSYVRLAMASRNDPQLRAAQKEMAEVLFPDGVQAFDLRAALDRIEVPARIIWGKQDDIIPWRHALHAPGRVGMHLFSGVGHMPQMEVAEEVGKIIISSI